VEDTEKQTQGILVVYMTTDISPNGRMTIYEALGAEPSGKAAIKFSNGKTGSN